MKMRNIFAWTWSLIIYGLAFATVAKLVQFLSAPLEFSLAQTWFYNILDNRSLTKEVASALCLDMLLVFTFSLAHSLLKLEAVKSRFKKYGLQNWQRSVYNIISCSLLLLLMHYWRRLPGVTIWSIDLATNKGYFWIYSIVHGICWAFICLGSLYVDLPELLGVKQLFRDASSTQASVELRRLRDHIRHPSINGLLVILWGANVMTLDRAVLAAIWSIYMFVAWCPDDKDMAYQRSQLSIKKYELNAQFVRPTK